MLERRIRVVHLATSVGGGAGIAAYRIHEALLASGAASTFISQGESPPPGVRLVSRNPQQRVAQKAVTAANRLFSGPSSIHFTPVSRGVVSVANVVDLEPDLVHVHNWYNFFDWRLAPKLSSLGVGVIATLHDERLLTGGCHYTLGCTGASRDCSMCPQSRLPRLTPTRQARCAARRAVVDSGATLVAPSEWLARQAKELGLPASVECRVIPNTVGADLLRDARHSSPRQEHVTIGVVLGKAPSLLQAILDELGIILGPNRVPGVQLAVAGDGPVPTWGGRIAHSGRIDSDASRARFWDKADVGLFVTRSDNFPNTILEGLARGVPQIVPDIGGAPEAVQASGGGLVSRGDPRSMAEALVTLMEDLSLRSRASRAALAGARELYAPSVIAEKYTKLYEQALESNG